MERNLERASFERVSARVEQGGGGPISFDGQTVSFSGGPLDGQAGKVEPGIVRLYNAERSRTIIDCQTKG